MNTRVTDAVQQVTEFTGDPFVEEIIATPLVTLTALEYNETLGVILTNEILTNEILTNRS